MLQFNCGASRVALEITSCFGFLIVYAVKLHGYLVPIEKHITDELLFFFAIKNYFQIVDFYCQIIVITIFDYVLGVLKMMDG